MCNEGVSEEGSGMARNHSSEQGQSRQSWQALCLCVFLGKLDAIKEFKQQQHDQYIEHFLCARHVQREEVKI